MRRVEIFDTTLRDGEQSPGISLSVEEKVEIARQLARLKVDVIEAGFPITSEGDFESVSRIASEVKGPRITGLARIHEQDIEITLHAERPTVRKETVAVERVRLDTEKVTEQQEVNTEVRKEQVDIEGQDEGKGDR